ncbi:integrase [Gossypium australe]|uniref:Integrase n=1 Tax=Gossypium australe TaxID=47621 RepID=A0A5B6WIT5_9ROSI|nr:integrase [Gossypium australe]
MRLAAQSKFARQRHGRVSQPCEALGLTYERVDGPELSARPTFRQQICEAQKGDDKLQAKRVQSESDPDSEFQIDSDGCLLFKDRICVPKNSELVQKILHEAHNSDMSVHLNSNKMYNDLKKMYRWPGIKRDISKFVSRCFICQQVKAEHQVPSGLLQPITILMEMGKDYHGLCIGITLEAPLKALEDDATSMCTRPRFEQQGEHS